MEGLLALGTVRAHKGISAPRTAVIEGARYDMKLFHSPNGQHIRTFYPMFLGAADIGEISSSIRIIAAMVNPKGHDVGFEKITLVNVDPTDAKLTNWSVRDKNNRVHVIEDVTLKAGEFLTIKFTGENIQLSNKGGEIVLLDETQKVVHRVIYSKAQARKQGGTILF